MMAGAGTLSGCSDFLDAENKTNVSAEDYFSTEDGLEGLRVYTYSLLKPIAADYLDMFEWGTDLYVATRGNDPGELHRYTLTAENSTVQSFYTDLYSLINNANCMIYYANGDGLVIAEAKFLRCYGYYLLTQHFGAVPYVTDYIQSAERSYPRTDLSEIYTALIEELEDLTSDEYLPAESHEGYISRQAVNALLAKVCLAAGWDLGTTLTDSLSGTYNINDTQYFTLAAQYAEEAMNGVSLTMSFEDKWSPDNEGNEEEIFSVQYDRAGYPGSTSDGGHGLQNTYGCYYGDCTSSGYKYCDSNMAPSEKAIYLWGEGDERFDATFMTTMYNYNGTWSTTGYYAYYNASNVDNLNIGLRYFPYYTTEEEAEAEFDANVERYAMDDCINDVSAYILGEETVIYTFSSDGSYTKSTEDYELNCVNVYGTTVVKKFDDPNTAQESLNTSNGYRDIPLFHVSDMYLTWAEAELMAGNEGEALELVNDVRNRSNAGALSSFSAYEADYSRPASFGNITALDVILDERARELFAERDRWMDLRRTRQLVRYNVAFNSDISSITDMENTAGEVKWYRPIPSGEISNNTALTSDDQNPGY